MPTAPRIPLPVLAVIGLFAAGITFLLFTATSFAQTVAPIPPIVPNDSTATAAPWIYSILVGIVSPLLTGIATKLTLDSGWKVVVNAAIVAALAFIGQLILGSGSFPVQNTLIMIGGIFIMNVAAYHGFWQSTVGPNLVKVSPAIANAGLGPKA